MKNPTLVPMLVLASLFSFACIAPQDTEDVESQTQPIDEQSTKVEMKLTPETDDTIAVIKTNHGDIKILLYTEEVPETTQNFLQLAREGKYEGVIFHRVINDFMIQTGDFENNDGTGGYSYKGPGTYLQDEFGEGLEHIRGAVSMANRGPNTGGSQFFIVQAQDGTTWLNGAHAIFGYVYEGMDVVDEIAAVEIDTNDKPVEDVLIETIEIGTY
jgi:peptidyl-prolyl cis-trans isomerase B (cyclophilin B)